MIITEEWLRENMNEGIGVSAKQLKALGLSYPPRKGWLKGIIGKEITEKQKLAFETSRKISEKTKKSNIAQENHLTGALEDSIEVGLFVKNLPIGEFMQTPFVTYGVSKIPANKCSVCGQNMSFVLGKSMLNVKYVPVCYKCNSLINNKNSPKENSSTVSEIFHSIKSDRTDINHSLIHNLTFDDMRKVGETS